MNWGTWLCNIASIIASGAISYWIARHVRCRAKMTIALESVVSIDKRAIGRNIEFGMSGKKAENLSVFKLTVKTGFGRGITSRDVSSEFKPSLRFKGFEVKDIQTINNDRTNFNIPIGVVANGSKLIFNINWIRHGTCAEFNVSGFLTDVDSPSLVVAELYPGLLDGVDIHTQGMIKKELDYNNFETEDRYGKRIALG